jgi:hypothetical protein
MNLCPFRVVVRAYLDSTVTLAFRLRCNPGGEAPTLALNPASGGQASDPILEKNLECDRV